jgi:hypothetical protein
MSGSVSPWYHGSVMHNLFGSLKRRRDRHR